MVDRAVHDEEKGSARRLLSEVLTGRYSSKPYVHNLPKVLSPLRPCSISISFRDDVLHPEFVYSPDTS